MLKNCLTTRNVNSSFIFLWRVFILSIVVAYGVQIAMKVSENQYDLGVKG